MTAILRCDNQFSRQKALVRVWQGSVYRTVERMNG